MRRSALSVIPALFLALNGCGGGGGGGAGGKGGGTAGSSAGGHGGSSARGGSGGAGGATGGSGGATGGSSGGAAGGSSGGATGGSSGGATGGSSGGSGGATGGSGGSSGGASGGAGGSTAGSFGGSVAGSGGGTGGGGSGGSAGGATGGSGGSTAACGDATDADEGLSCNALDPTGPCVIESYVSGSPPAPTGGQIVAGTYDLVSRTAYAVPDGGDGTGADRRETVVIAGSGDNFTVQITQTSGTTHRRQSGTAVVSGTTLMFTQTCPTGADGGDNSGSIGFDANTTTFTIHDQGGNGTMRVSVYTKR